MCLFNPSLGVPADQIVNMLDVIKKFLHCCAWCARPILLSITNLGPVWQLRFRNHCPPKLKFQFQNVSFWISDVFENNVPVRQVFRVTTKLFACTPSTCFTYTVFTAMSSFSNTENKENSLLANLYTPLWKARKRALQKLGCPKHLSSLRNRPSGVAKMMQPSSKCWQAGSRKSVW